MGELILLEEIGYRPVDIVSGAGIGELGTRSSPRPAPRAPCGARPSPTAIDNARAGILEELRRPTGRRRGGHALRARAGARQPAHLHHARHGRAVDSGRHRRPHPPLPFRHHLVGPRLPSAGAGRLPTPWASCIGVVGGGVRGPVGVPVARTGPRQRGARPIRPRPSIRPGSRPWR